MTRVAIYTRLSVGSGDALERQRDDCLAYAESRRWEVAQVYREPDTSAFTGVARPEFDKMLKAGQAGEFSTVLVWKSDRAFRRLADVERVIDMGLDVVSLHDGLDSSTPMGKAVLRIAVTLAALEAETNSLRIRSQRRQAALRGDRSYGGNRPFGLSADWSELVSAEAEAVRDAAARVIAGQSLRSVAVHMNTLGLPPAGGGKWNARGVKNVLRNPRVVADRAHLGEVVAEGDWPAVLDRRTYDLVGQILDDPTRYTGPRGDVRLLTGIAFCGACGARMRALKDRYVCRPGTGCGGTSIGIDKLDEYVTDMAPGYSDVWGRTGEAEETLAKLKARRRGLLRRHREEEIDDDDLDYELGIVNPQIVQAELDLRGRQVPEFDTTRGYVHAMVSGVYVVAVGKGNRNVKVEDRVVLVGRGGTHPETPIAWPLPPVAWDVGAEDEAYGAE